MLPQNQSLDVFSPYTTHFLRLLSSSSWPHIYPHHSPIIQPRLSSMLPTHLSSYLPAMCPLGGPTGIVNTSTKMTPFPTTAHRLPVLLLPHSLSCYQIQDGEITSGSSVTILSGPVSTKGLCFYFLNLPKLYLFSIPNPTTSALVKAF